ncbi:MAG: hypothetical protein JNL74_22480, partial [Fibrobacteres bacterium]|nr:hypothetical protein [Fibrobacterota bacterium]
MNAGPEYILGTQKVYASNINAFEWDTRLDGQILAEGNYRINVKVEDLAGNITTKSFVGTVDNTPPHIENNSLQSGQYVSGNNYLAASCVLSEPCNGRLYVRIKGTLTPLYTTRFNASNSASIYWNPASYTGLQPNTELEIVAEATDLVGNVMAGVAQVVNDAPIYYDSEAPTYTSITFSPLNGFSQKVSPYNFKINETGLFDDSPTRIICNVYANPDLTGIPVTVISDGNTSINMDPAQDLSHSWWGPGDGLKNWSPPATLPFNLKYTVSLKVKAPQSATTCGTLSEYTLTSDFHQEGSITGNPYVFVSEFTSSPTLAQYITGHGCTYTNGCSFLEPYVELVSSSIKDQFNNDFPTTTNVELIDVSLQSGDGSGNDLIRWKIRVTLNDPSVKLAAPITEGTWYLQYKLIDAANNSKELPVKEIEIDNVPPVLTVTSGSNKSIDNRLIYKKSASELNFGVAATPGLAEVSSLRIDLVEVVDAGVVPARYQFISTSLNSIDLSMIAGIDAVKEGRYTFKIYTIDEFGNNGLNGAAGQHYINAVTNDGVSCNEIIIENQEPNLVVDVLPTAIPRGGKITVKVFWQQFGYDSKLSYNYTCKITLNKVLVKNTKVLTKGVDADPYEFVLNDDASLGDGAYELKVELSDIFGGIAVEKANINLGVRIPEIAGDNGWNPDKKINGPIYIMGNVGDPDIATVSRESEFDKYEVYYKQGVHTKPSDLTDLSGWLTREPVDVGNRIYAPLLFQSPEDAPDFYHSNISRTETSPFAKAALLYFDTPANWADGTDVTFLVVAKEKNDPSLANAQASVSSYKVDRSYNPVSGRIAVENLTGTAVAGNAGYTVAFDLKNKNGDIALKFVKKNSSGQFEKTVCEFVKINHPVGTHFSYTWDYRETGTKRRVPDGNYSCLIAIEENNGPGFVLSVPVEINGVNTSASLALISVDAKVKKDAKNVTLLYPPVNVGDNDVTVSYKIDKEAQVQLIGIKDGTTYELTAPVTVSSGADAINTLTWSGPASDGTDLPYGIYDVKLKALITDDNSTLYSTSVNVDLVKDITPPEDYASATAALSMPLENGATKGSSEVVWRTKMAGYLKEFKTTAIPVSLLVTGTQKVPVWKNDADCSYRVSKVTRVNKIKVKIKYKIKVSLQYDKGSSDYCDDPASTGFWVNDDTQREVDIEFTPTGSIVKSGLQQTKRYEDYRNENCQCALGKPDYTIEDVQIQDGSVECKAIGDPTLNFPSVTIKLVDKQHVNNDAHCGGNADSYIYYVEAAFSGDWNGFPLYATEEFNTKPGEYPYGGDINPI